MNIVNANEDNGLYECLSKITKRPVGELKGIVTEVLKVPSEELVSLFEEFNLMEMFPQFFD